MLKYIIALCIISFCDSFLRVGDFQQLILIQQVPLASYFWQQVSRPDEKTVHIEFLQYKMQNELILEPNKWIIQGLWPIDGAGNFLAFCKDSRGNSPQFERMDPNLRKQLRNRWPALRVNKTEWNMWVNEFNTRGCCVSANSSYYFDQALTLSEKFDVGKILTRAGIEPGKSYVFQWIAHTIILAIGKTPYIRCVEAQNPQKQHLVEVQICLDQNQEPVNCQRSSERTDMFDCTEDKGAIYSWVTKLNEFTVADKYSAYSREHGLTLEPPKWIIYGLWPINIQGDFLSFCTTANGSRPRYSDDELSEEFKRELKSKWPGFDPNRKEDRLWGSDYNMRGCCFSSLPSVYFETSAELYDKYEIGTLLARSQVYPRNIYALDRIVDSITEVLGERVFVLCTEAENPEYQHLVEVQICFNPILKVISCVYTAQRSRLYKCDKYKKVIYS